MSTEEQNILIAEFMGYTVGELHGFISGGNRCSYKKENGEIINAKRVEKLKYNSSWDWLMPVVEMIECKYNTSFEITIFSASCYIHKWNNDYKKWEPFIATAGTKRDAVYEAVVKFIQWYNENK